MGRAERIAAFGRLPVCPGQTGLDEAGVLDQPGGARSCPAIRQPRKGLGTGRRTGFTLMELMIVLVLIGLLISMVLPSASPALQEQLRAVGQIISTDLAYARSLAIAHGSTYRLRFEVSQNRYILQHTGADPTLNLLPASPWRNPEDPPDQHIVRLDALPQVGRAVRLAAVRPPSSTDETIGEVEFGPLGGTTASTAVVIWLSAGQGQTQRFLAVTVDPITGLASLGTLSAQAP
jgi:prepilin-type N-terminal cleavage/methylation domain-containing protein